MKELNENCEDFFRTFDSQYKTVNLQQEQERILHINESFSEINRNCKELHNLTALNEKIAKNIQESALPPILKSLEDAQSQLKEAKLQLLFYQKNFSIIEAEMKSTQVIKKPKQKFIESLLEKYNYIMKLQTSLTKNLDFSFKLGLQIEEAKAPPLEMLPSKTIKPTLNEIDLPKLKKTSMVPISSVP